MTLEAPAGSLLFMSYRVMSRNGSLCLSCLERTMIIIALYVYMLQHCLVLFYRAFCMASLLNIAIHVSFRPQEIFTFFGTQYTIGLNPDSCLAI